MVRMVLAVSLFLLAGVAQAEEIKGQVRGVDPTKSTITVMVGEEDKTFDVAKDARITVPPPKKKKGQPPEPPLPGLQGVFVGTTVTLTVEKKDDKQVVTAIKGEAAKQKKK